MKRLKCKHFWAWFAHNQQTYRKVFAMPHSSSQFWLEELDTHVARYQRAFGARLYLNHDTWNQGQLVISAQGAFKLFSAVERLVAKAPAMTGWEFIALHPPVPAVTGVEAKLKHAAIVVEDLLFDWRNISTDTRSELPVYASGGVALEPFGESLIEQVVYNILGERMFGDRVAYVVTRPLTAIPKPYRKELLPLDHLPQYLGNPDLVKYRVGKSGLLEPLDFVVS